MLEEEQKQREILEANRCALEADRDANRPFPPSHDGGSGETDLRV